MNLIKTPKDICEYIGEAENRFLDMVKNECLPAWQSGPRRMWKAKPEDLDRWIDKQRNNCMNKAAIDVLSEMRV